MNWRGIRTLIGKDLKVVLRTKAVLVPLILVPLLVQVIMPAGFGIAFSLIPFDAESDSSDMEDLQQMMAAMPPGLVRELEGMTDQQAFLTLMMVYFFAPMYLIVPLMVSSVFAADSFAGEKERKTLEALLHTPLTDTELIVGKMLAAWLPALAVSVISFILYTVAVDATTYGVMGRLLLPNLMWMIMVFWVAPGASALGLAATILVSSKVKTFQEAYQLSVLVVLPMVVLMLGQVSGLLFLSPSVALMLGVVLWIIAAGLLALGVSTFQRSEIIARL
jgi:ABC-2 type transport system permease protein